MSRVATLDPVAPIVFQPAVSVEHELAETRDAPAVAQPLAVGAIAFQTLMARGPKLVRGKLYELPNYSGPQLALVSYKTTRGQGYRVYLPKSGILVHDNNGVGELYDALAMAVRRVAYAKQQAQAKALVEAHVPVEVDGVTVYPTAMGGAVRWAIQSFANVGKDRTVGDALFATLDEAMQAARVEADHRRAQLCRAALQAEQAALDSARVESNRGLTLAERRANAYLDHASGFPASAGLGFGSRRQAIACAVAQGLRIVAVEVADVAARNRDTATLERGQRAGYLIGLSNENIPLVRQMTAAKQRLTAKLHHKLEYRLYVGVEPSPTIYVLSKTEYDYAQSLLVLTPIDAGSSALAAASG